MAEASASRLTKQDQKQRKSRQWTETEVKYSAIVLTDDKNDFGYKLDRISLNNSVNKII